MLLLIAESMCGASFCILRAIFVATPGEVCEVEIFLRFDGVPELALSSLYSRAPARNSPYSSVSTRFPRGLTFTCVRGSVIFSNMLDFAVYGWTTCVACPLAAFGGSISPWYSDTKAATAECLCYADCFS